MRLILVPGVLLCRLAELRAWLRPSRRMPEIAMLQRVQHAGWVWDGAALGILAGVQGYLFWRFGLYDWDKCDCVTYVDVAKQFASGEAWGHILASSPYPVSLFRLPGYPLLIAATRWLTGADWQLALSALQMAVAVAAGFVLYRVTAALSGFRWLGLAAALIWASCERARWDRFVLTDSLETSLLVIMACWLAWLAWRRHGVRGRELLGIGAIFMLLQLNKELTSVVALSAIPLLVMALWTPHSLRRTVLRVSAVFTPMLAVSLVLLAWNYHRTGRVVFTTGAASALMLPLVEAQHHSAVLFGGDSALDRAARANLQDYTFAEVMEIDVALVRDDHLTTIDIAGMATAEYLAAWLHHPVLMARMTADRLVTWRDVMQPYGWSDWAAGVYPLAAYTQDFRYLFALCLIVLPLAWLPAAAVVRSIRREAMLVIVLVLYALGPTVAYAAVHVELRYLLFTIAPLLTIFALSTRALAAAMTTLGRLILRRQAEGAE